MESSDEEPMTMLERVARGIATRSWRLEIDEFKEPHRWAQAVDAYDLTNNNGRFEYDQIAVAAIEAMRIPTKSMLEAGVQFHIEDWRDRHQSLEKQWEAAIDAALKENEEKA
jgi:hypothetical protein